METLTAQVPEPNHSGLGPEARFLEDLRAMPNARPHSCVYVSTPITTGRFVLGGPIAGEERRQLVADNIRHARDVTSRIQQDTSECVIDPTTLDDVDGWEQHDYHAFWLNVIDEWAGKVVFCNGWQYSTGCSIEMKHAVLNEIVLFDEDLTVLTHSRALALVAASESELMSRGLPHSAQRDLRAVLESEPSDSR